MSKEELNNEFDVAVRVQKAFDEATKEKVAKHQGLNDKEIEHLCPVAFKSTMSKKELTKLGLSKHYSFVPTSNVINDLRSIGWEVVDAALPSHNNSPPVCYSSVFLIINVLEKIKFAANFLISIPIITGIVTTKTIFSEIANIEISFEI